MYLLRLKLETAG